MIPEEYRTVTLDSCLDLKPSIIEMGKQWARHRPLKSLYIYGDWGCGKTTFAFAILRFLKELPEIPWYFNIRYITGKDFDGRLLKASRYEDGDEHQIQSFAEDDLLFIDDVDKVSATLRLKNQMFEIINRRKLSNRPTIITSNLSPAELPDTFDGSVVSRIGDESRWSILKFPDGDLRKKKIKSKIVYL